MLDTPLSQAITAQNQWTAAYTPTRSNLNVSDVPVSMSSGWTTSPVTVQFWDTRLSETATNARTLMRIVPAQNQFGFVVSVPRYWAVRAGVATGDYGSDTFTVYVG